MGSRHSLAALAVRNGADPFENEQQEWMEGITATWPDRWRRDAVALHAHRRAAQGVEAANRWLLDLADKIAACRIAPNATDGDIRAIAEKLAKRAAERARRWAPLGLVDARREVEKICASWGIQPPKPDIDDAGALARLADPVWWRRKLRRQQGREREAIAIDLGYVHAKRDIYLSRESFEAEKQKRRRNADILANTEAISEDGEIFTLSDLAEHSLSNPTLRRGEMMTRIKGCEEVSRDLGHVGIFVTLTVPSRMHARLSATGAANPAYDGTTPRRAQAYLCNVWEDIRSSFKNAYIDAYGLRIAEPHHDGTPHWHMLLFVSPLHADTVKNTIRRYALRDTPEEKGAAEHRVRFEDIDPAKGSAVAYVAKYVGKNIDGTGIEFDENGVPAAEAIGRVTAWAGTHGIRQFQFIGGPPVGLWRELRRIKEPVIADAPEAIGTAWRAAQKTEDGPANYAGLIRAVGGPVTKRNDQAIQLATAANERAGRYGWATTVRPVGIFHIDKPKKVYQSERKTWQIRMKAGEFGRWFAGDPAAAYRPWTRVNNCAVRSGSGFPGCTSRSLGGNVIEFPRTGPRPAAGPPGGGEVGRVST